MADEVQRDNPAYPKDLKDLEDGLLKKRRGSEDITNKIGFGLSGGGIRSATFCLGVFQGLAKQELPKEERPKQEPPKQEPPDPPSKPALTTLLSKIDYLSTVSGGGFFGSFYGRLFTRDEVNSFEDVADILTVRAASQEQRSDTADTGKLPKGKVFRWLRENGRYLAPNGAGDLLLAAAAVTRNLAAVQVVLATFVMMIFLFLQLVRGVIEVVAAHSAAQEGHFGTLWSIYQDLLVNVLPGGSDAIWWSPYTMLPVVAFLFLAVPPAWAYWLVEKPNRGNAGKWIPPIWGIRAVLALSFAGLAVSLCQDHKHMPVVYLLIFVLACETRVWAWASGWTPTGKPRDGADTIDDGISDNEDLRLRLSKGLKTGLVLTGVSLALVLIDSFAQTAYTAALLGQLHVKLWLTAALAPIVGLGGFGRRILNAVGDKSGGKSLGIPLTVIAGIAAIAISALLLVMLDVASYAIAWKLALPTGLHPDWTVYQKLTDAQLLAVTPKAEGEWTIASQPTPSPQPIEGAPTPTPAPTPAAGYLPATPSAQATPESGSRESFNDLRTPGFALLIAVVMSFLFGWSWPFLNRSTQHPIYTSRLIRAYLGASNPKRLTSSGASVTQVMVGDDIPPESYWPRHRWLQPGSTADSIDKAEAVIFGKGAPLHLVNVTINETLDSQSQVEQQDRKGLGMAVGPAAISAGVVHHLVLAGPGNSPSAPTFTVYPPQDGGYCVFRYPAGFNGEFLSLGNWTGISGAAFSTSLGSRTSLSFSVLAGIANVRLSYWWNSGVAPLPAAAAATPATAGPTSPRQRWTPALFQLAFKVQSYLFDELFARFHGTARQWWPLSDGGHFENMGGYELIRRRLDVIVIVDAEADPDYTFEGMTNLVRKARLDFGAEITFLTEDELNCRVHRGVRKYFGTLEQLRRGTWIEEPVEDPNVPDASAKFTPPKRKRLSINPVDENALSLAHAALATVTYNDERPADGAKPPTKHWLLYIKPGLVGDEPADVRRYHTEHPSFPNETTAEQFFDEAQWESYRRLGEHIADKIFRNRDDNGNLLAPEGGRFFPYRFGT